MNMNLTVESGVFLVSARTNPTKLAGAIASTVRTLTQVELRVVGAGAVNQAIKAIAIGRGMTTPSGFDLNVRPSFLNTDINGQERSSINLVVERVRV